MEIKKINVYEIIIVLLIGVFLYFYIDNSNVGRFQINMAGDKTIDTKTGETYELSYFDDVPEQFIIPSTPPVLE